MTSTTKTIRDAELAIYRNGSRRPITRPSCAESKNPHALTPQEQIELLEEQSAEAFYPRY